MMPKKKGVSMLAIKIGGMDPMGHKAEGSPEEEAGETPAEEKDEDSHYEMAASEVLDAVKAGDAAGLAEALKAFVDMCSSGGE